MLFSLITCREALLQLDDFLDRELSSEEIQQVEKHLHLCHHCAEKFSFEGAFLHQLKTKVRHVETADAQVVSLLQRIKTALPKD
jgi:anti-sigma factor RsiW